jgi:predicted HD phosphohydrolase
VLEPIKLHVEAKRYLCHAEPGYWQSLSPASRHSLALQGGVLSLGEATAFLAQPFSTDAVRLRRWDDRAKLPGVPTLDLGEIERVLADATASYRTGIV